MHFPNHLIMFTPVLRGSTFNFGVTNIVIFGYFPILCHLPYVPDVHNGLQETSLYYTMFTQCSLAGLFFLFSFFFITSRFGKKTKQKLHCVNKDLLTCRHQGKGRFVGMFNFQLLNIWREKLLHTTRIYQQIMELCFTDQPYHTLLYCCKQIFWWWNTK